MGSEYELDNQTAGRIREIMQTFANTHTPGQEFDSDIKIGHVDCSVAKRCEIQFRDTKYGGEAYVTLDNNELTIQGPDMPFNKEYELAAAIGIPISEDTDWCIRGDTGTSCSKRRW